MRRFFRWLFSYHWIVKIENDAFVFYVKDHRIISDRNKATMYDDKDIAIRDMESSVRFISEINPGKNFKGKIEKAW